MRKKLNTQLRQSHRGYRRRHPHSQPVEQGHCIHALESLTMIPWIHLDTAKIPDGGELRLKRRGAEFSIMLGTNELMNSRLSGSEEALAKLSCDRISSRMRPHMLIGGLGMGFTLRAALAELGDDAQVTVAELAPAVVAWARGPMTELFGGSLDDPRVTICETDMAELIRSATSTYDAILLDVDNGPEGLSRKTNDSLYDMAGLAAARVALKAGGVLAVWSQGPDARFAKRLRQTGFAVEEVKVRARGKRGARHIIWMAANEQRQAPMGDVEPPKGDRTPTKTHR